MYLAGALPRTLSAALRHLPEDPGDRGAARGKGLHHRGLVSLHFTINVVSISGIDTVQQFFNAEFVLRCTTRGARNARLVNGAPLTASSWEPRLKILNLLDTYKWRMGRRGVAGGELQYKYTIAGRFAEEFELRKFPMDVQMLSVIFSSAIPACDGSGAPLLRFGAPRTVVIQRSNFMASNVYDSGRRCVYASGTTVAEESTSMTVRPRIICSVVVSRKPEYFLWSVYVPLLLLTGLTLGTFQVPKEDVADRLAVAVTLVLTATTFKFVVADDLPRLSYTTWLDQTILTAFYFVLLVALEVVLAHSFFSTAAERWISRAGIALWLLLCAYTLRTTLAFKAEQRAILRSLNASRDPMPLAALPPAFVREHHRFGDAAPRRRPSARVSDASDGEDDGDSAPDEWTEERVYGG